MTSGDPIIDEAVRWHLASRDDEMDWDAFTLWLEADPAHARAYDEVSLTDALLDGVAPPAVASLPLPLAANDEPALDRPNRAGWRRWAGAAVAATLVALIGLPVLWQDQAQVYRTQDQSQTVTLADGSQVILAPDSQLTISGDDQQQIALAGGAYFAIRHDPGRQLAIAAGPITIKDIGTAFDVQADGPDVRVAVSEGQVSVSSAALVGSVGLAAGRQLHFDGASGRAVTTAVDREVVGGWRTGQLSYAETPLALVCADLDRYAGVRIDVPAALGDRLFSGTLAIDDGTSAARDLAQLMGLSLVPDGAGYRLGGPAR